MAKTFNKIAIANRGEVAVRIIRACQELGISTVLLHSEADVSTLAYRLSDEQICIGEAEAKDSYLNIDANINAALSADADAVHPGFGFLSENADFARACEKANIAFIGPTAESINLFGDKISAKKLVLDAGGPVIPGYQGEKQDNETLLKECEKIGYPLIVKAAAGGGGRGLKVVHKAEEAEAAIDAARREGASAFGSGTLFLEKYLDKAKHIELQMFGDSSGKIHCLYDRECSVQRRHQKVIEEAISANLPSDVRQKMMEAAVKICQQAKYRGAGTIEFLYQDNEFYFLEMNTRLQVEHPVTEVVLGVDLVRAQILTAQEQTVLWNEDDLQPKGHAIECRLYAEDPYMNGMPSTGQIGSCYWPAGPNRRFEIGFEKGDEVSRFYDSMIAKLIVWDENRPRAIERMKNCLRETIIFGVKTNIPYLISILENPEFVSGEMTTQFIDKFYPKGLEKKDNEKEIASLAESLKKQISPVAVSSQGQSFASPWNLSEWV